MTGTTGLQTKMCPMLKVKAKQAHIAAVHQETS